MSIFKKQPQELIDEMKERLDYWYDNKKDLSVESKIVLQEELSLLACSLAFAVADLELDADLAYISRHYEFALTKKKNIESGATASYAETLAKEGIHKLRDEEINKKHLARTADTFLRQINVALRSLQQSIAFDRKEKENSLKQ